MLIEANDHEPFEEAFGCEVVRSAEDLLPLVYDELRRLAARRLAKERPDQTLQATALVHEAYMRLVKSNAEKTWDGRRHFFAAAAEAMRRILVNRARDRNRLKRGGNRERIDLDLDSVPDDSRDEELLALDEAIESLEKHDEACAKIVSLRFFAGLTQEQAAEAMGISRRTADRHWAYAKAWLYDRLKAGDSSPGR